MVDKYALAHLVGDKLLLVGCQGGKKGRELLLAIELSEESDLIE